jgi:hypothetical protein
MKSHALFRPRDGRPVLARARPEPRRPAPRAPASWPRTIAPGQETTPAPTTIVVNPAAAERAGGVPQFQVDPFWPKPLPNNWILGQVAGVAVDKHNHVWIVHRPGTLSDREVGPSRIRPTASAATRLRRCWYSTSPAI